MRDSERAGAIRSIVDKVDLARLLEERFQYRLHRSGREVRVLCPFHADRDPSLRLYEGGTKGPPHYHCYSCRAHGNCIELVKKLRNCDFITALRELSQWSGVPLPSGPSGRPRPRAVGLERALAVYRGQMDSERDQLDAFARDRGYAPEHLAAAEAYGVKGNKLIRSLGVNDTLDLELIEQLSAAGILVMPSPEAIQPDLPFIRHRDRFFDDRILFVLRDRAGELAGFAGRRIAQDSPSPKYLYTSGFRRGETLYRHHVVRALLEKVEPPPRLDIYVVEGLLDALRLEALGQSAVAILGSRLTTGQTAALRELVELGERRGTAVAVHLFLDGDAAGWAGTVDGVSQLLREGLLVDAVVPFDLPFLYRASASEGGEGPRPSAKDPDEYFKAASIWNPRFAVTHAVSAMAVLVAESLGCRPDDLTLNACWTKASSLTQAQAMRSVERRFSAIQRGVILARAQAFRHSFEEMPNERPWATRVEAFLATPPPEGASAGRHAKDTISEDDGAALIRATLMAAASPQRREFPVDEGAWERHRRAPDFFMRLHGERLSLCDKPLEPFLGVWVPKGTADDLRVKALPCPEDLVLQQYVLTELLRDHPESAGFLDNVPAIRYWRGEGGRGRTTGMPVDGEAIVSFAYQVDMDVVNGRVAVDGGGMFRPYYDCWLDFVRYIDRRASAMPGPLVYAARLDVKGFYDHVRRSTINDALIGPIERALAALPSPMSCAPLFSPSTKDSRDRAYAFVDWMCQHSFGYAYSDPASGSTTHARHDTIGIPQGPDLSAYLANVVLLPLDHDVQKAVLALDKGSASAAPGLYARYVDDMVIAARSEAELARLRRMIEERLARLGLELSDKTEPLPPMTIGEFRRWVTANRGTGLTASGPAEFLVRERSLIEQDPFASSGDVDRPTSLSLLHDPQLDSVATSEADRRRSIRVALQAEGLRHGEYVIAARLLWRDAYDGDDAQAAAKQAWSDWQKLVLSSDTTAAHARRSAFLVAALLGGLERRLNARTDRSPALDVGDQKDQTQIRQRLARLVGGGLCEALLAQTGDAWKELGHMLALRLLAIRWSAVQAMVPEVPPGGTAKDITKWLSANSITGSRRQLARFQISLAEQRGMASLFDMGLSPAVDDHSLSFGALLLHEVIARWRSPDEELHARTRAIAARIEAFSEKNQSELAGLLKCFGHLASGDPPHGADRHVVLSFVRERAPETELHEILANWMPHLLTDSPNTVLPVPPGIGAGELFVDKSRAESGVDVQQLRFTSGPALTPTHIQFANCKLSLNPVATPPTRGVLQWVASGFRALADKLIVDIGGTIHHQVPTYAALATPPIPEGDELPPGGAWELVSHRVFPAKVGTNAFVRVGERDLVTTSVAGGEHAHLWRLGVALTDRLGRTEGSAHLAKLRLSAPMAHEGEWATRTLLRLGLAVLRGHGARYAGSGEGLPPSVERVLTRMEEFPSEDGPQARERRLIAVVETLADMRAANLREHSLFESEAPGCAAALLVGLVESVFRCDEALVAALPPLTTEPAFFRRRPALAWAALATRVALLEKGADDGAHQMVIDTLARGCGLRALALNLRAQVLELGAVLKPAERRILRDLRPDLQAWGLDGAVVLHRDQLSGSEDAGVGTRLLLTTLSDVIAGDAASSRLDNVTPAGWLVALATLLGVLPETGAAESDSDEGSPSRLALRLSAEDKRTGRIEQGLRELAHLLARSFAASGSETWRGFGALIDASRRYGAEWLKHHAGLLSTIDDVLGFSIQGERSPHCPVSADDARRVKVRTADGSTYDLSLWQVQAERGDGARPGDYERHPVEAGKPREYVTTTTRDRFGRLLGVALISNPLAHLAGLTWFTAAAVSVDNEPDRGRARIAVTPDTPGPEAPSPAQQPATNQAAGEESLSVPAHAGGGSPSPPPTDRNDHRWKKSLNAFKDLQSRSWEGRAQEELTAPRVRVALAQLRVSESYSHPFFEVCGREDVSAGNDGQSTGVRRAADHRQTAKLKSCAEGRRRAILTEVLRACLKFKVDVLVLPEYSVRPETVRWLAEQLENDAWRGQGIAVWAGTCRLAPGYDLANLRVHERASQQRPENWSAILPFVLKRKGEGAPFVSWSRSKKYPSVAANEWFQPPASPPDPIHAPNSGEVQSLFDPPRFIQELICSEIFLLTSPANWHGMTLELQRLRRAFNLREEAGGEVLRDAQRLGQRLSLDVPRKDWPRRSILVVPALTRRAQDYATAGQQGFLSAGLWDPLESTCRHASLSIL